MDYIVIFSTDWGALKGGINAFNLDFATSLANNVSKEQYKVICFTLVDPQAKLLPSKASPLEVRSLGKEDATLDIQEDISVIKKFIKSLTDTKSIYFVGHDTFTGKLANLMATEFEDYSLSIVLHHMNYQSYYGVKGDVDIHEMDRKITEQEKILRGADIVVGVGPKLTWAAKRIVDNSNVEVRQILPGLQKIDVADDSIVMNALMAVTFGRYDARTDNLKQMKLAAISFAEYTVSTPDIAGDRQLKIIGISENSEADDLRKLATANRRDYLNIVIRPYRKDREQLFSDLRTANLSLMLSVHEGFGLAGLESIAAGVPLVLSKNSGLHDFLLEKFPGDLREKGIVALKIRGTNDGSVNADDVQDVTQAINDIVKHQAFYRAGVRSLREALLRDYTWNDTANSFIAILERTGAFILKKKLNPKLSP